MIQSSEMFLLYIEMGPILNNKARRNVPHCYLRERKIGDRKYYVKTDRLRGGVELQVVGKVKLWNRNSRA